MRVVVRLLSVLFALVLAGSLAVPASAAATDDIVGQLKQIPGLTIVKEEPSKAPAGYRYFDLKYTQLADHRNPATGTFQQGLILLHKDTARPMVEFTTGYDNYSSSLSEPTKLVDGNQLDVEYRYFSPSIPAKTNWPQQLTIWQAATDQHEITKAFKKVYQKNWLATGGSKGGMTATYFRRFYPNDVNGTVPYVAPNDVIDPIDSYNNFLSKVGNDPACRDNLKRIQRETLQRRGEITKIAAAAAAAKKDTFTTIGSLDKSLETSVIDSYFGFWQYQTQADCAKIPPKGSSAQTIYNWYEVVDSLLSYSDQDLAEFVPYYYQAAYQLGAPEAYDSYLRDLLRYPGIDEPNSFIPKNLKPIHHDYIAMPDVDFWVRTQSQHMLYIYGSNDPWGAEPFDCGLTGALRDCHRYFVAGGNHGSQISQLPADEKATATALVRKWAGVSDEPTLKSAPVTESPLMTERPRL